MLDTNALSAMLRDPHGPVAKQALATNPDFIAISVIVAAELRFGLAKRPQTRISRSVRGALTTIDILPFEPPADETYGRLRAELERAGTPIGPNDMLIAAHALATDRILVTGNVREFSRVPGLAVEDWSAA